MSLVSNFNQQAKSTVEQNISNQELKAPESITKQQPIEPVLKQDSVTPAPKLTQDDTQQIIQNIEQKDDSIAVDQLKKTAVNNLYTDEVALKNEENIIDGSNTADERLYDPTTSTDASPFSDFLPQIRTSRVAQRLQEWQSQIPDAQNTTQETRDIDGQIVVEDVPAQSIAGLNNGYNFGYSRQNPLWGECAYMAQQWTSLENGQNWTIGSTIGEKKQQLANHIKSGNGFYVGDDVPTVGNSIVFNGAKYGHVAVIAEIKNGKARLEEANANNDHRYSNSRWVDLSDPTILGFLKTVKRK